MVKYCIISSYVVGDTLLPQPPSSSFFHSNNLLVFVIVLSFSISARITVMPLNRLKASEFENNDLSSTPSIILPSGIELSMAGAPPLERDLLKKCLSVFTSRNADLNYRYVSIFLMEKLKFM